MAKSLTEIANDEATDKGTCGPLAPRGHNYTDIYECYLAEWREKPITLLEIGLGVQGPIPNDVWLGGRNTQGGASMRMWYRYFPHARILGIDINPAGFLDNERIRTGVADQGDPRQLLSFLNDLHIEALDVIVDDGSHQPDHQQISLSTLFPLLAPGGIYFIEDLLANGLGDKKPWHRNCEVLNTRQVLKGFVESGTFPEPNAFVDGGVSLAKQISRISFHCPRVVTSQLSLNPMNRAKLAAKILFGERRLPVEIEYRAPGREDLCAITKA
jgi:hypothetical protein